MAQGAVLCVACGFDTRTGRRIETRTQPPHQPVGGPQDEPGAARSAGTLYKLVPALVLLAVGVIGVAVWLSRNGDKEPGTGKRPERKHQEKEKSARAKAVGAPAPQSRREHRPAPPAKADQAKEAGDQAPAPEDEESAAVMLKAMLEKERSVVRAINEDTLKYSPRQTGTTSSLAAFEQRAEKSPWGGVPEKDETATPMRMRDPKKIAWFRQECTKVTSVLAMSMENISIYDKSSGNVCFWKQVDEPQFETREETEKRRRDDRAIHEKMCSLLEGLLTESPSKEAAEKTISDWCEDNNYDMDSFHSSELEAAAKPVKTLHGPAGTEPQKNGLAPATDAGGGNGSCTVRVTGLVVREDEADVTVRIDWKPGVRGIKKQEVTVVFLFQRVFVAKLYPALLTLSRTFSASFPKPGIIRITSGLDVDSERKTIRTTEERKEFECALIMFNTLDDAALNLLQSGEYTFPIKLKAPAMMEEPNIRSKGILSVVVFKEDDPRFDQMKSTKYVQLSNEIRQSVDFARTGRFSAEP